MTKICFFVLLLTSHIAYSQINFGLRQELEKGTGMGEYMKVSGNTMFLSQVQKDEVKVYSRQEDGTWIFQQTLKPSDKSPDITTDWGFGNSMALNDSNAVITAVYKGLIKKEAGGVYFYRKGSDGLWQEEFVFENPTTFNYYGGKNIAIHKNRATVSHDNGYPRFVHIFERQHNGTWVINDTIRETEFRGLDGIKAYFDDTTFIAMSFEFEDQKVKEFRLQSNGDWTNTQTLETGITTYSTYFGQFLSVDNNYQMAVSAPYFTINEENTFLTHAGKVYIYERVNNAWVLQQELISPAPHVIESFGKDVLIKGDILIIVSQNTKNSSGNFFGSVRIYNKINTKWTLTQTYYPENQSQIGRNVFYEDGQIISFGYNGVHILEIIDCEGIAGRQAKLNSCGICYGGTTGLDSLQSEEQCLPTSVYPASPKAVISVSPNPFDNQITIEAPDNATISLTDCYGKILARHIATGQFDASHLHPGMYFLIVESEGEKYSTKLFKK